jgi:hypothetical protein
MRNTFYRISLSLLLTATVGCTASPEIGGSGGTAGGGSGGSSAGSGGSSSGTGGTSVGSGGTSGGSGGDTGSGGSSAGTGGTVITDGGGSGGAGPTDGPPKGDGGVHTPMPSPGCGKPNPSMPKRTIMTGGMTGNYNVNVPANYDINKPMPLGFGFHGFGNGVCGPTGGECQGFAMLPAITVYLKSLSAGWEGQPQPLMQNLQFYHDVLNVMKNEYCVDLARIFIAGVSSGAQFIEQIACRDGASLWQVTAVSGYVDRGADMNCMGTPAALITQGATEVGGVNVMTPTMFAKRNGCSATPPADYAKNLADMKASFMAGKQEVRCMDWDGCTLNPVRYCISSQMTYGGLTHGWPRVGGMLIGEFQNMLPK